MTHEGLVIWLTGLSGAGKTTIAERLVSSLLARGYKVELLDGDVVRTNLSKGLGFSREDRDTNIQRIGFVAGLLARNGVIVVVAAISPYASARDLVRRKIQKFVEVYVACPLSVLVQRDTKGLYRRALSGEIEHFTGISDPYEPPSTPDVVIHTDRDSVEDAVDRIYHSLDIYGVGSQARILTFQGNAI